MERLSVADAPGGRRRDAYGNRFLYITNPALGLSTARMPGGARPCPGSSCIGLCGASPKRADVQAGDPLADPRPDRPRSWTAAARAAHDWQYARATRGQHVPPIRAESASARTTDPRRIGLGRALPTRLQTRLSIPRSKVRILRGPSDSSGPLPRRAAEGVTRTAVVLGHDPCAVTSAAPRSLP